MPEAFSQRLLFSFRHSTSWGLGTPQRWGLTIISKPWHRAGAGYGLGWHLCHSCETSVLSSRCPGRQIGEKEQSGETFCAFRPRQRKIDPVTETWLTAEHGDDDLLNACPAGYSAVHVARSNKRGGGVALIYREFSSAEVILTGLTGSSFEHLAVQLRFNSSCVRLVVVYRPQTQSTKCSDGQFLTEFSSFLQPLVESPGKLLIVGDFNIHVDVTTGSTASHFSRCWTLWVLHSTSGA